MSKTKCIWAPMPMLAQRVCAAMAALLAACAITCFSAAVTPDVASAAEEDATLTLLVNYEDKGKVDKISGAEFTVYQVASIDASNRYALIPPFDSVDVDLNANLSASQAKSAAKSMEKIVDAQSLKGIAATSDDNGKASFGVLDQGVYLVVQTAAKGTAQKYNTMPSFLINVPQFVGGEATYNVVAQPKAEPKPEVKPTPPSPSNPPQKTSPKTGDDLDWGFVTLFAVAGMTAMVLALFAARKRKE